jgi:hypothetical protein
MFGIYAAAGTALISLAVRILTGHAEPLPLQ